MVAKELGDLGPIYGKQWRSWHTSWDVVEDKSKEAGVRRIENGIDQIANLINELKTNPDSRRLMVSAWNAGELDQMVLPPCHYGFQVYTRELPVRERLKIWIDRSTDGEWRNGLKEAYYDWDNPKWAHGVFETDMDDAEIPTRAISLMFNMRSSDVALGLPFNLASYGLLLEILAKEVNMLPDELIANLGDSHIYLNQIDRVKEQLTREPYELPKLVIVTDPELKFDEYVYDNFKLFNYQSHPTIKIPLSN